MGKGSERGVRMRKKMRIGFQVEFVFSCGERRDESCWSGEICNGWRMRKIAVCEEGDEKMSVYV